MTLEKDNPREVSMSAEKYEELIGIKIAQEVKSEVVEWVKRWAIVLTVTVALIGTIGLNVLVAMVVRSFLAEDIEEAQRTSAIATDSLNRARQAMEKATRTANQYTTQVDELSKRAKKVENSFSKLDATIEGSSRSVRRETRSSIDDLQIQVESLNKTVATLMDSVKSQKEANKFRKTTKELEEKAISKRSVFESNSKYTVQIAFFGETNSQSEKLSQVLEKAGFQTEIFSNASKFGVTGVPQKFFLEDTPLIIIEQGQKEISKSIIRIAESVIGKGSLNTIQSPPSFTPEQLVIFLK